MAPRVILRRNTPARHRHGGKRSERLAINFLASDVDIDAFRWHREQFAVIDLLRPRTEHANQHFASPGHGDECRLPL